MSDDVLKLIPADPHFMPPDAAQKAAVAALEKLLPEGERCRTEDFGPVTFIDQGENLESVLCPACGTKLSLYGTPESESNCNWWHSLVDELEDGELEGVSGPMPCCGSTVQLTSLQFHWPGGFARFELCIWNPGTGDNLTPSQVAEFEAILGCKLLQVRAHY
jgi:hypothetical protein